MRGFVRDYYTLTQDHVRAGNVMKCFTAATLPVLTTLATQYAVCDRWFSAVPGSTIPNRMFVHGANSVGSVNQDAIDAPFLLHTIFESFDKTTPVRLPHLRQRRIHPYRQQVPHAASGKVLPLLPVRR